MTNSCNRNSKIAGSVSFFVTPSGDLCPVRILSMLAVLVATLVAVFQQSATGYYILYLLTFGFAAEVRIVLERAKQPPSLGGTPGLFTDHEGYPSSLRVKSLLCCVVVCFIALSTTFFPATGSSQENLALYFAIAAVLPKGVLAQFERRGVALRS